MNYKEVEKLLPNFTNEQLQKLKSKIDFLLKDVVSNQSGTAEFFLYTALSEVLKKKLRIEVIPFPIFKKKTGYGKKLGEVRKYLDDYLNRVRKGRRSTRTEKYQYYLLFANIMIDDLEGHPSPTTVQLVLNCYQQFPSLLDKQFPGYAESGLLEMIFKGENND